MGAIGPFNAKRPPGHKKHNKRDNISLAAQRCQVQMLGKKGLFTTYDHWGLVETRGCCTGRLAAPSTTPAPVLMHKVSGFKGGYTAAQVLCVCVEKS